MIRFITAMMVGVLFGCSTQTPPEIRVSNMTPFQNEIRQTFIKNQKDIQTCYEAGLKTEPALEGKIVFAFDINDKGGVSGAQVDESKTTMKGGDGAKKCIVGKLSSWTFPASQPGEMTGVKYPLGFSNKPTVKD